jgi:hypothetical protein
LAESKRPDPESIPEVTVVLPVFTGHYQTRKGNRTMDQSNQKGTPDVPEMPDGPEKLEIEAHMFPNDYWYGETDGKVQMDVVEQDEELYRYLKKIGCKIRAVDFWQDDHLVCATIWTEPWDIWVAILVQINRERDGWTSGMIKAGKD